MVSAAIREAAEAATQAAIHASLTDIVHTVAEAVKAKGGSQADVCQAAADAAICAFPKRSRPHMTDDIFKAWDVDGSGKLEFAEILPKYMKASNHTEEQEEKA